MNTFFFTVSTHYHFLLGEINRYIQFGCFIEHCIPKIIKYFYSLKDI